MFIFHAELLGVVPRDEGYENEKLLHIYLKDLSKLG